MMDGGMMGLGWIVMLLFWGIVAVGVVLAARWLLGRNRGAGGDTPHEILKRRYAAGEISKEEYERMRRELEA
ncbi:MAG: SHOCT domain-containing protein [Deltaproteobacteria bacterium]|nr:SHOCT domain-containing protein [Deltaproteobacteria bacterium]